VKDGTLFSVRHLSFRYGAQEVLHGIDVNIDEGEMIGIIGPNGAGKSTLLRLFAGYLTPVAGSITFSGRDLHEYDKRTFAQGVATLPQVVDIPFSYRVEEFILMGRYPHAPGGLVYGTDEERFVDDVMDAMSITHLRGRRLDALSEGERQRVFLAQCIAQDPKALLLDEPISHLDIKHQIQALDMLEKLHAEGLTIVMILHDLNLAAEFCSRLILLSGGTIKADGPPKTVLTFRNLEEAYDTVVIVKENPLSGNPFVLPVSKKYLERL
jgi:iron complex transport system ATP-binding protein